MKISSTYTVALQLLLICKHYENEKITSAFISRKIGADPAVIRRVMADLKSSGYIESKPGPGGTRLLKALDDIILYDVYKAVTHDDDHILKFYDLTCESSSFEEKIKSVSDELFTQYISSFYSELKTHSIEDIYNRIETPNCI
jgi:DNA-binding IscR family transcriptional regulator